MAHRLSGFDTSGRCHLSLQVLRRLPEAGSAGFLSVRVAATLRLFKCVIAQKITMTPTF